MQVRRIWRHAVFEGIKGLTDNMWKPYGLTRGIQSKRLQHRNRAGAAEEASVPVTRAGQVARHEPPACLTPLTMIFPLSCLMQNGLTCVNFLNGASIVEAR